MNLGKQGRHPGADETFGKDSGPGLTQPAEQKWRARKEELGVGGGVCQAEAASRREAGASRADVTLRELELKGR